MHPTTDAKQTDPYPVLSSHVDDEFARIHYQFPSENDAGAGDRRHGRCRARNGGYSSCHSHGSPGNQTLSDLAGGNIAIDDKQSAADSNIRTAMAAAGAAEVQLTVSQTKAIDRLIGGEVPASVLTLASPEAAEGFTGFKIFRVPLSERETRSP
jgi:hypothetical protein